MQSVREVVPGRSNNEIILVLQYYDYSVETAIQAYLEGGCLFILDWPFYTEIDTFDSDGPFYTFDWENSNF